MMYHLENNCILINSKKDFNIKHILECGQIFSYKTISDGYVVYSGNKCAKIIEQNNGYRIYTTDTDYFINFFDLNTDYASIKESICKEFPYLLKSISYGSGIRILKQDIFETIISFIISANNNIKRIQKILFSIREHFGTQKNGYFAFPTCEQLINVSEEQFKEIGAGYRAKYLVNACKFLINEDLQSYKWLDTIKLKDKLLNIAGVGPKVADCIMLFAFSKGDVFPVDTWIEKVYCTYFDEEHDRAKIREKLVKTFGNKSGYVQQYLFYSQREDFK